MLVVLSLLACTNPVEETPDDTGTEVVVPTCDDGLLQNAWVTPEADPVSERRATAADATISLANGETVQLSAGWQGCETWIFIPHKPKNFSGVYLWEDGLADLVDLSPANTRYVFFVDGLYLDSATEIFDAQQARVDSYLATLSEEDAAIWKDRLLVVSGSTKEGWGGWLPRALSADPFENGMVIDRSQKLRGIGGYADVEYYDADVRWYDSRLRRVAHEADYLNWEEQQRQEILVHEADSVRVPFWGGEVLSQYEDITVTMPDDLSTFDTLEIEVLMECPDRGEMEQGNCGAWDYLGHMWVLGPDGETWMEMARYITTYHRESHWFVDATHAMPWLQAGQEHTFRYEWAPSWNVQPTGVTASLRFSNQGKGYRPVATTDLHTGGSFNASYNDGREAIEVEISADAKKVEFMSLVTGHGGATNNCAEFCDHRHAWDVDGTVTVQDFPEVGDSEGCSARSGEGVVANQPGTWWFGRGGWCPGEKVHPFVIDATDAAADGKVSVGYSANYAAAISIPNDSGNIELRSWLVVYE